MRKHTILITGSILLLSACAPSSVAPAGNTIPQPDDGVVQDTNDMVDSEGTAPDEGRMDDGRTTSDAMMGEQRVVEIKAENWAFTPDTVTFRKGENAVIRLESIAGTHGFMVQDLNINVSVTPGQTVDVSIPTDTPGTYSFRCSVPCGEGHMNMTGTIVIEE